LKKLFKAAKVIICISLFSLVAGCTAHSKLNCNIHEVITDPKKPKNIFVFFDGTANSPKSQTNVWKLWETVKEDDHDQIVATYCPGVGSLYDKPLTGNALGRGMEERILAGYGFITRQYGENRDDNIHIFGFSRGAHQARALAGLISYAGIPKFEDIQNIDDKELGKRTNKIIELLKKESDIDYLQKWKDWSPGTTPFLGDKISEKLGYEVRSAQITFLGVWDTVPGSSLKNYGKCKEDKGIFKKYLYWLIPGVDKGDRYKSDSYPTIKKIFHAVSMDEKRSKFRPILICAPINPKYTEVEEKWFPGAHADVGGGYEDSSDLPHISLNWLINHFKEAYDFKSPVPEFPENPKGLAHWSRLDKPANIGSKCEDREAPPPDKEHVSVQGRRDAGNVLIRVSKNGKKEEVSRPYPIDCEHEKTLLK
jgi:hypothetical protein